jgi:hypothetical protein
MKMPIILVAIVIGLGLLFLLLRSRVATTYKVAANEIPSVVERLQFGEGNPRFAVFMFTPADSKDGVPVNLQFSFENGVVGLDWVLLSPRNVADQNGIIEFAKGLSHSVTEHNMNNVRYLRVEGSGVSELGTKIIRDFYKIDPSAKLEMIAEGFKWQSVAP